jgi:phage baseplate assembly protein W
MSISLIFPLQSQHNGFQSYTDEETTAAIKQNLKMLLLTSPGEYVMDADFGVGLYNYLFELGTPSVASTVKRSIRKQVSLYMPYVRLEKININFDNIDSNTMNLRIEYKTSQSAINEVFDLTTTI